MKTYKTRDNAVKYAETVAGRVEGTTYIITVEADGRFAPLFFNEDIQNCISLNWIGGRSMKGTIPRHWQTGQVD